MQHLFAAILLSIAVGLTSAISNIHAPALAGTGRSAATCGDPDDSLVFYRIHSASTFSYSYGTDLSFVSTAIRNSGYLLDGVMGRVFVTQEESTVPCYSLLSNALSDTLLTTNATERDAAVAAGYGVDPAGQTYIYPTEICGSIPMYRLYNSPKTSHFVTTSESERLNAISSGGYADQGIMGYILPATPSAC
ncbi:hypothetical protein MSAN_01595400 [Mycena sanguinolenta]|uniref:DUF5648 domain-containing protein n=1 Tax=Mycena sanguinolenta TaxID=230812 RepID=A0A8H7CY34_9AGAR|nr:hypothetical protein MSAN_01595400 [Mycena sanguinolenta]